TANRGRVFVAGNDNLQVVLASGVASGPAVPIPCPGPLACERVYLVAEPADGFRIVWQHPGFYGGSSSVSPRNRDAAPNASVASFGVLSVIELRPDGGALFASA